MNKVKVQYQRIDPGRFWEGGTVAVEADMYAMPAWVAYELLRRLFYSGGDPESSLIVVRGLMVVRGMLDKEFAPPDYDNCIGYRAVVAQEGIVSIDKDEIVHVDFEPGFSEIYNRIENLELNISDVLEKLSMSLGELQIELKG